jgi:hypothetical protein
MQKNKAANQTSNLANPNYNLYTTQHNIPLYNFKLFMFVHFRRGDSAKADRNLEMSIGKNKRKIHNF